MSIPQAFQLIERSLQRHLLLRSESQLLEPLPGNAPAQVEQPVKGAGLTTALKLLLSPCQQGCCGNQARHPITIGSRASARPPPQAWLATHHPFQLEAE